MHGNCMSSIHMFKVKGHRDFVCSCSKKNQEKNEEKAVKKLEEKVKRV